MRSTRAPTPSPRACGPRVIACTTRPSTRRSSTTSKAPSSPGHAGDADGFSVDAYVLQTAGLPDLIQVVQQSLASIGVTVNIHAATNYVSDFLDPPHAGFGVVPNIGSNRTKLDQWTGDALGNACKYDDPDEALKAQLLQVSDTTDEAVDLWNQIEQKAIGDDMLSVPLLFAASVVGYNPAVVADPSVLTVSTQLYLPDPRITYVKAK